MNIYWHKVQNKVFSIKNIYCAYIPNKSLTSFSLSLVLCEKNEDDIYNCLSFLYTK